MHDVDQLVHGLNFQGVFLGIWHLGGIRVIFIRILIDPVLSWDSHNVRSMKRIVLWVAVLASTSGLSQKTSSFTISGEVKSPSSIQASDLKKWKIMDIGDLVITNHLGEKKSEALAMKGVLLTEVLESAGISAESPKVMSSFYFVCKASDGYVVTYSWNELFNSPAGKTTFLVTERNGKSMEEADDGILMVSTADYKTGRRYLKSLASLKVKRAR